MSDRRELRVEMLGGGRFRVSSIREHLVVLHPHGPVCDCTGFHYRGWCSHVEAVEQRHDTAVEHHVPDGGAP